jgi:hypothetical protein
MNSWLFLRVMVFSCYEEVFVYGIHLTGRVECCINSSRIWRYWRFWLGMFAMKGWHSAFIVNSHSLSGTLWGVGPGLRIYMGVLSLDYQYRNPAINSLHYWTLLRWAFIFALRPLFRTFTACLWCRLHRLVRPRAPTRKRELTKSV